MIQGLTEGRIVHYILDEGPNRGEERPAIVVRVWRVQDWDGERSVGLPKAPENGCCNLQVFTDSEDGKNYNDALPAVMWVTSVLFGEGPGTWHWIEKA